MRRERKNKRLLSLCILFIFISSFSFGAFFIPNTFGSVQDEDYSIESDFNVFENLPYMYSGTFYESTDYKYKFDNAKIQFQFEDFSYDEEYPVTDSLDNSESNQVYGEDNFTFTDGSGADFDNMMAEDLVYSYFNFTGIGLYNATHSFTDELEGTTTPTGWVTPNDVGYVAGELDGHNKIYYVDNTANEYKIYNEFDAQTSGTIEFWMRLDQDDKRISLFVYGGASIGIYLDWSVAGELKNKAVGAVLQNYLADTWYHYQLIFDCSPDTFDLWIDGNEIDTDLPFLTARGTLDKFNYHFREVDSLMAFDAVDYSWDPSYEEGRNREENWVPIDYEATYSFESDDIGSVPSGWGEAATATVVPAFNKHNQVLELERVGSNPILSQIFTDGDQTSGTIEWWMGSNDVTHLSWFRLRHGSTSAISICISTEKIQHYLAGYNDITDAKDNVMYHIRIDFECGAGEYKGLAADTYYIYINGVKFGAYAFKAAVDHIDKIYLNCNTGDVYNAYYDAIGYSWDTDYDIGDNYKFTPSIIDNFPASYSFYKQPVWTSDLDIDFISQIVGANTFQIEDEINDHRKVLNCTSDGGGSYYRAIHQFKEQLEGTIEFWLSSDDTTFRHTFYLTKATSLAGENIAISMYIEIDNIYIGQGNGVGGTNFVDEGNIIDDEWVHFKFSFNTATDTFSAWINDVQVVFNENFINDNNFTSSELQYITLYGPNIVDGKGYWDAFGFSWDNRYLIGDNLNDNFYLGYENFEGYNKTEYGNYFGTYSFDDLYMEEGVHYGTYDFRDDVGNTGTGISWVDTQAGTDAVIEVLIGGHKNVLMQTDNGGYCYNSFSSQTSGMIEYWIRTTDATPRTNMYMYGDGGGQYSFRINFDTFIYTNDVAGTTTWECLDDTWYHIKYVWRVDGTTDIYSNGVLEVDNETLTIDGGAGYNSLRLQTYDTHDSYLDAIGYSWDTISHSGLGYEVGYNINDYDLEPLLEDYFNFNAHYGMNVSIEAYYDFHNFVLKINDYYYSMTNYYEGVEDFDDYLVYTILGDYEGTESFDYTTLADYYYGTYDWRDLDTETETYYGTHDFRDEVDGTSGDDIGFVDFSSVTGTLNINSGIDEHTKIIYCNPLLDWEYFRNEFTNQENGTIEFWIRKADAISSIQITMRLGTTVCVELTFSAGGDITSYTLSGGINDIGDWVANTWYHFRVDFDCSDEEYDVYLDGVLLSANLKFREWDTEDYTFIDRIYFGAHNDNDGGDLEFYLDAFGCSWDTTSHDGLGYTIDYNKISYDIEPILETGMNFDNIEIGDYCNVVNPFNNHRYSLMINGSVSATIGSLSNREPPDQFGDFDFAGANFGVGDSAGDLDDDDGDYAQISSEEIVGGANYLYSDPSYDDFNSGWTTAPLWSKIDDGIRSPTTSGFTDGIIYGDNPDYCYFDMTDVVVPANNYITGIVVYAYRNTDDTEYNEYLEASYRFEGTTAWSSQISISGTGWAWDSAGWAVSIALEYGDTEADALQVRLDCEQFSADTTEWEVEALYARIAYQSVTYDLDYTVEWDVIDVDLVSLTKIYYEYKTTVAIEFQLQIYDYVGTDWETLETETTTNYVTGSVSLTGANTKYVDGGDTVKVRFHKTGGDGAVDMDQYIDYLYIDYSTFIGDLDARSFSVYDTFSVGTGVIEFWAYFYDSPYVNQIIFNNDTQIYLNEDGKYCFYNGTETIIVKWTGGWNHFKIDWTGNDVDIYINGTLRLSTFWAGGAVTLDRIDFMSFEGEELYIDAIGYDWDSTSHSGLGYTEGYNINPYDIVPLLEEGYSFYFFNDNSISINSNIDGHTNVLDLYDNSAVGGFGRLGATKSFSGQTSGIVEFWMRTSDATKFNAVTMNSAGLRLLIWEDKFQYYDGAYQDVGEPAVDNAWYHIKIDFDCGTDKFDLYINGTLKRNDLDFWTLSATLSNIAFSTLSTDSNYHLYIDALGYDWESYTVNDNCNPYGVLTDLDDNWDITYTPYTSINILDELDFHYQVLNMTTWTEDVEESVEYSFSSQAYGTIDFWTKSSDCAYRTLVYFPSGCSYFYINNDKFKYYDGAVKDIPNVGTPLDDTWHHITWHFCFDSSEYANLGEDQVRFVIDGIDSGALDMAFGSDSEDDITILTSNDNGGNEHSVYFDAFDFSWDASYIHPAHNEIPFGSSYGNNFTVSSDETIEMWISGNFSNYFREYFYESGAVVFAIKFDEDYFYYTDMGVWTKDCWVVSDWTHLKIYFEASTNTYDIWINGTLIAENIDSHIAFTTIDEWSFETEYYVNSTFYLDAIGYSWESDYDVDDNINSYGKEVITALESKGWSIYSEPFEDFGISGEFNSHKKFLNITDDSTTGESHARHTFSSVNQMSGIVEFYIQTNDVTGYSIIRLYDSGVYVFDFRMQNTQFKTYHGGAEHVVAGITPVNDVWYYIKIEWYDDDTWDLWIDGIQYEDGIPSQGAQINGIDYFYVFAYEHSIYIDALHYSWEDTNTYFKGEHTEHCDIEAIIDFTVEIPFDDYDKEILWIDIESVHYTSTLTNVSFNYYNQTSSSWYELNNTVNTSPTSHDIAFSANTLIGFFDGSGIQLKFYMYNHSSFYFLDDIINVTIWYKTELNYEHTLEWIGSWRYRFLLDVGLASSWNSSWIIFDVVAQPPNFEGISESRYSTKWVLTSTATTGTLGLIYSDELTSGYWDLVDASERNFYGYYDIDQDSYVSNKHDNPVEGDINFGTETTLNIRIGVSDYGWDWYRRVFLSYDTINEMYFDLNSTWNPNTQLYVYAYYVSIGGLDPLIYLYNTTFFGEYTITWNNQPATVGVAIDTHNTVVGDIFFDLGTTSTEGQYLNLKKNEASAWDLCKFHSREYDSHNPKVLVSYVKNFHNTSGEGYAYMQTDSTETLGLISQQLSSDISLSEGDIFTVDLQTTSSNALLELYNDNVLQSTFNLLIANTETARQEVEVYVSEDVIYDQVKITSGLDDTEYFKLFDIKAEHWTFVAGEEQDSMYVEPFGQNELIIDTLGNSSLKIYENDIIVADTYVDISYDLLTYVYESPIAENVFVTFYDSNNEYLDFNDFTTYVNYTLYEEDYGDERLTNREFYADEFTNIYFDIYDSFNVSVFSESRLVATLIDITLPVYELKIKNEALELVTYSLQNNITAITKTGNIFPEEIVEFSIATGNYSLDYTNYEDSYPREYNFELTDHKTITINTTYHTVYIGLFTYDGLGLNRDWVRLYINDVRADFGFNVIQSETANLTVLDYFNNTLASVIIDASAWSEYNLYAQVYSMYILNQFTYNDLIVNITQVDSGMWMNQLIPSTSALLYRFIPNINYTINATYVNGTVYSIRTINLTDNSQIESFGIPSAPEEYPKDVYFGVYTTLGLGIDHDLLKFYIDNNRTDFGFNRITDEITNVTVTDFFDTILFTQLVNFSGIYEYDILITLYSLKVKNEARVTTNYTLSYGASETTGYILPEEIIEYQLSSNNYVFDYTNNEDNSFHTININLNQDRVYILNTTYYNIFFSLCDLNLHVIDSNQYIFRLNGTREVFGFIYDLTTDDYTITVVDRFGTSLFNDVVTLRGLNEYVVNITLYELQISHLARVNGNLTLSETTTHNYFEFLMSPNSQESFILGGSTYNVTWLNNENSITTTYDFTLNSDYILTLNTSYYNIFFSLFDLNLHVIDSSQYVFRLNSSIQDFGMIIDLQTGDYNITVVDRFGTSLFDNIITLRDLNEYRIDISLYELQIRHLARENGNLTLSETTGHSSLDFNMAPDSLKSFILGSSTYNISWLNNENSITTTYDINLITDYILTLNTSYYNIFFSLFDLNLHNIDPNEYVFRLNGTREVFGFIEDLTTDDYTITVVDRFGINLFNNIITLRGLNEYVVNITLYELQIRHLARENGNLTLSETTGHGDLIFTMSPDSLRSFMLGSSTYNVTWLNNENSITTTYDFTLNTDYILTLNTSYYNIFFSLFDLNLHTIYLDQYEFRLNGTLQDLGLIVDLQTDDYTITITDRFENSLFNNIVTLRGLNEYRINITLFELQISHLARVNGNLTLSETTTHNYFDFLMSPNSQESFILGSSTYNVTWLNNENGITTTYDINLNMDYILTLNTSYYNIYFNLFDLNLHNIDPNEYVFRLNGSIQDFGLIVDLQTNNYTITITDRFGTSLFNSIITLRGLNEYRIDITLYELQIRHLAYENSNLTLYETTNHNYINFSMAPDTIRNFMLGSSTYNITWINGENYISTLYNITLNDNYILTLNSSYFEVYFGLYTYDLLGLNKDMVRFYINGIRKDLGFNTLTQDINTLVVRDYLNQVLNTTTVNLRGYNEYNIYAEVYTIIINNLYNNYTLRIVIEREDINEEFEQYLPAQTGLSYRFLPNVEYKFTSYFLNGTKDQEFEIDLTENNMPVDFGFYSTTVPIVPEPLEADFITLMVFVLIVAVLGFVAILAYANIKKDRDEIPEERREKIKRQQKEPWKAGTFKDEGYG